MRYHPALMQRVRELYTQDLSAEQRANVLWVGPLMDGLLELMPEMWTGERRVAGPEGRRAVRLFFEDIRTSGDYRAYDIIGPACIAQRDGWPVKLMLSEERVVNLEPGELLNSVVVQTNDAGETIFVDPVPNPDGSLNEIVPRIREDRRYGLHRLWRGDIFEFRWTSRRPRQSFVRQFKLKPRAEGTSELLPEQRTDLKVF